MKEYLTITTHPHIGNSITSTADFAHCIGGLAVQVGSLHRYYTACAASPLAFDLSVFSLDASAASNSIIQNK